MSEVKEEHKVVCVLVKCLITGEKLVGKNRVKTEQNRTEQSPSYVFGCVVSKFGDIVMK